MHSCFSKASLRGEVLRLVMKIDDLAFRVENEELCSEIMQSANEISQLLKYFEDEE